MAPRLRAIRLFSVQQYTANNESEEPEDTQSWGKLECSVRLTHKSRMSLHAYGIGVLSHQIESPPYSFGDAPLCRPRYREPSPLPLRGGEVSVRSCCLSSDSCFDAEINQSLDSSDIYRRISKCGSGAGVSSARTTLAPSPGIQPELFRTSM